MSQPQTFRSPTAVVVWVVWLLFAVANWIDLAVQGRDHESAVTAAVLLLATGIAYVLAQRPRVSYDDSALTIRNPLRDYRISWAAVAKVDLADLMRVHCDTGTGGPGGPPRRKVISTWAVHYSRRRQLAAEARARRAARPRRSSLVLPSGGRGLSGGRGAPYGTPVQAPDLPSAEAEAEKIARLITDRAEAARAEAARAEAARTEAAPAKAASAAPAEATQAAPSDTAAQPEPLTRTWSPRAVAALVIPALIVLLVWLL